MQFIDEAAITVAAGDGGDGIVAWRREKYVPKGGPAGGDGGHGGSVYIEATPELSTLIEFRFRRSFAADSGKPGSTSNKSGRSGDDLTIAVPVGTLVFKTRENGDEDVLADLHRAGARVLAAKGGRGGLGNQHFATSVRQAPRFSEKGEPGERFALRLELRLLADCGIIGVPNAGKSTLLSVISAARPKIADYPFTTLEPQLGVVRVSDEESFVMVDVPGLVEGAHEGIGLGDQFLNTSNARARSFTCSMERSRSTRSSPRRRRSKPNLAPGIHICAKSPPCSSSTSSICPRLANPSRNCSNGFRRCAASVPRPARGCGTLFAVARTIERAPIPEVASAAPARIELAAPDAFHVERRPDGAFVVSGERVERLAAMTNFDSDEALVRFERALGKMGVEKRLRELGATEGDTVHIGPYEFTYS